MNDLQKVLKLKTQQKLRKNNESKGQFVCAFIGSSYSHRTVYRSICQLFFIVMDVLYCIQVTVFNETNCVLTKTLILNQPTQKYKNRPQVSPTC